MRKSIILTAAILLFCSYTAYADKDCTTKYQEIRDSISEEEITQEEKKQAYIRLSDAENFCNAGNVEEERQHSPHQPNPAGHNHNRRQRMPVNSRSFHESADDLEILGGP